MRKVVLSMKEDLKYATIKRLVETKGNKARAAITIGCTERSVNRMIKGYKEKGKAFFIHGNKDRTPSHAISEETKKLIIDLYMNKYYDTNFYHFNELIKSNENINFSNTTIRSILMGGNITSPKATKKTKRIQKKLLEEKQKQPTLNKNEKEKIIKNILELENLHPRRPRCAYFGELIQLDASTHIWFNDFKCHLHLAVDDATGTIVGAYFDKEETLCGYYNVLNQILINHGIPYKFLTDRRTVFDYKKLKTPSLEKDTYTQFGYACKQLGIDLQSISIAQAKGRVERMFQTLQSRLPVEMRLKGVNSLKGANEFLNSYIKKFNERFALPLDNTKSVFETQPSIDKINLILSTISKRTIDNGHCIRYENKYFSTVDKFNSAVYLHKGTHAMIIKAFDGKLYANINDNIYALIEVPDRSSYSFNFDPPQKSKPKKIYIPPLSHPWKKASFESYLKKQSHRSEKTA